MELRRDILILRVQVIEDPAFSDQPLGIKHPLGACVSRKTVRVVGVVAFGWGFWGGVLGVLRADLAAVHHTTACSDLEGALVLVKSRFLLLLGVVDGDFLQFYERVDGFWWGDAASALEDLALSDAAHLWLPALATDELALSTALGKVSRVPVFSGVSVFSIPLPRFRRRIELGNGWRLPLRDEIAHKLSHWLLVAVIDSDSVFEPCELLNFP